MRTWTVQLTRKAYKQFSELPLRIQDLADLAIHDMEMEGIYPKGWDVKKTAQDEYRLRITYRYRMRFRASKGRKLEIEIFLCRSSTGGISMSQMKIHHELGDVVVRPADRVNASRLKRFIQDALDRYQESDHIPASAVHELARGRHEDDYHTPGYFLRLYRQRAELTQAELAGRIDVRQHHLSEMEHNKRPISKTMAQRLARELDCDYRRFL